MAPKRPTGAGAVPKPVEGPAPDMSDPSSLYAALDGARFTPQHPDVRRCCRDDSHSHSSGTTDRN